MQKAAEDLRNEAKKKQEEKENYITERVKPVSTDGLGEGRGRFLPCDGGVLHLIFAWF